MFRRICLIIELPHISEAAVSFTADFAARMNAAVTLLVLSCTAERDCHRQALERLASVVGDDAVAWSDKPSVQWVHRAGDPARALAALLSDRPPFQSFVWGSSETLPPKTHWLYGVMDTLEGPLLTVNKKTDAEETV